MMAGASSGVHVHGDSSGLANRSLVSSKGHQLRKRRSKGTIAGFAHGKSGDPSVQGASHDINGETGPSESVGGVGPGSSGGQGGNQGPQHTNDSSQNPAKPCPFARLSMLCCQNAIRMGARTQLGLCPPGRARRGLQAALRQRTRSHQQTSGRRLMLGNCDTGGSFGLEKMIGVQSLEGYEEQEEDYLLSTNTFDVESDEEASSGDEDELNNIDDLLSADPSSLDDEKKYAHLREPLFTPAGAEGTLSNPNGAPGMGGGGSGKLPFNRRKIRYFDTVTAVDRAVSRAYLKKEATKAKLRGAFLLTRGLKRLQREARRRRRIEKGFPDSGLSDSDEDSEEKSMLTDGVSQFEHPMTSAMSAALILESLSINPLESIEGMAKCYDGIVAAGVALLDAQISDPTSPTGEEEKHRPSRSEVVAALAPLLITSLEQASGEVILLLAKLRRICGTNRYQRRFVQRIAPSLIRPPGAAMWCLRHLNDMEPILAAAELIFDSAPTIFSKGWYERGQLLLADSKRAETLNTAAMQLRNLSAEPSEGLSLGFSHAHGHRRPMAMFPHSQGRDGTSSSSELAEWEVIAVDRQIRISISNILSSDWSTVVVHSKEEITRSYQRRSRASTGQRPSVVPHSSSGEASPRSLTSPRSPTRLGIGIRTPMSPPSHALSGMHGSSGAPQPEQFESIFSASSQPPMSAASDRPSSPDGTGASPTVMTLSPPSLPHRTSIEDVDTQTPPSQYLNATPPRSPRSSHKEPVDFSQPPVSTNITQATPQSPRRNINLSTMAYTSIDSSEANLAVAPLTPSLTPPAPAAPLSPSSVGTSGSAVEFNPYRPSSSQSVASTGSGSSQTAHYRMLTSTASERKRTVAACRALRAQITRFEEAFFQLHGRPPKGAAERAPLATTYSQYREWKRAIRADAACRIQALVRGARTRWMLLRSKDPRVIRVVYTKAGLSTFSGQAGLQGANQENVVNRLGIPVEIGENEADISAGLQPPAGVDAYISQSGNQPLAPIFVRRGGENRVPDNIQRSSPTSSYGASSGLLSAADVASLSLSDLQARKRELKQQLKQYDMNFARQHGRMPVKAEKEPIRHLYENYNALKGQISVIERDGRHSQSPVLQQSSPPANMNSRSISPSSASASSQDTGATEDSLNNPSIIAVASRGNRRNLRSPPPTAAPSTPSGAPSQDLSALKVEKGQLHQMLRSYEKDFFREHRRQVSSFADIRPVASQYRRYKEIKRAIAALQQGGDS